MFYLGIKSIKNYKKKGKIKLSSIIKKINYSFFLLLFLSIFFIQSGYSVFFDGLPWLNNIEVVTTCLFIPIILIFKR